MTSSPPPRADRLAEYLRSRRLLLVFDNCEHLLDGCAALAAELLARCPALKILATSRSPLNLAAEQENLVAPLALPVDDWRRHVDNLQSNPAVALFLARARAVNASLRTEDVQLAAVVEICKRLDGVPLAIELAAARTRILTPGDLLKRLSEPLSILTGGSRDLPPRQRTLRQTIDWSYELLSESERAIFACLSVFAGGATLEAIEAVCGEVNIAADDILSGIDALVRANLVRRDTEYDGTARFGMLETIREYASERLATRGDIDVVRAANAQYCLALTERAYQEEDAGMTHGWVHRLDAERDNVRAALRWADDSGDGWLMLRLAASFGWYWLTVGSYREGIHWLERALVVAPDDVTIQRATAYTFRGLLAAHLSDYTAAESALRACLRLFLALGSDRDTAWALLSLGRVLVLRGDFDGAIELLEQSIALSQDRDVSWGNIRGLALNILGTALLTQGGNDAVERAEPLLEKARMTAMSSGHQEAQGLALVGLAWAAHYSGRHVRASKLADEALAIAVEELHHVIGVSARLSQGWFALCDDRLAEASSHFRSGLRDAVDASNMTNVVVGLGGLAALSSHSGEQERAARLFAVATSLLQQVGSQMPPSRPAFQEALASARASSDPGVWERGWTDGMRVSLDHAVAEALSVGV